MAPCARASSSWSMCLAWALVVALALLPLCAQAAELKEVAAADAAMAPAPEASGGADLSAFTAYLESNGFGNFSSFLTNTGIMTILAQGIADQASYTVLGPGDYAYPNDFQLPEYCASGRNYDVDFNNGVSFHGLMVINGLFSKTDLQELGFGATLTTLTPVVLTSLPTAALVRLGVVDGLGRVTSDVYLETDLYTDPSGQLVFHAITDFIQYPQI